MRLRALVAILASLVTVAHVLSAGPTDHAPTPPSLAVNAYDVRRLVDPGMPSVDGKGGRVAAQRASTSQQLDQIVQLIRDTIEPGTWRMSDGDGKEGNVAWRLDDAKQPQIVVAHTFECLAEVRELFRDLSVAYSRQVTVELRLCNLNRDVLSAEDRAWLEELDDDMGRPLDDQEMARLIAMVQQGPGLSIVTAPRVTVFNGGSANVDVGTTTPYVSEFVPRKDGKGYEPIIRQANHGVKLDVQAGIVPGRQDVILRVAPAISQLLVLGDFDFITKPEKLVVQEPRIQEWSCDVQAVVPSGRAVIVGRSTVPAVREDARHLPGLDASRARSLRGDLYVLARPVIIGSLPVPGEAAPKLMADSTKMATHVYDVTDIQVQAWHTAQAEKGAGGRAVVTVPDLRDAIARTFIFPQSADGAAIRLASTGPQLVVRQTPQVHAKIAAYLDQLRNSRMIPVAIEAYFVVAGEAALADAGMDVGAPAPLLREATTPATRRAVTSDDVPHGAYLDQRHVDWIMSHLDELHARVIASPMLMTLNGHGGQNRAAYTQAYVASAEPTTQPSGRTLYRASVKEGEDGVTLHVRTDVSEDRQHIRLEVKPILRKLLDMQTFTFDSVGRDSRITIQQPTAQAVEVETNVIAPDGKWLLLGGQAIAPDTAKPGKDRDVLLILLRAKIIDVH